MANANPLRAEDQLRGGDEQLDVLLLAARAVHGGHRPLRAPRASTAESSHSRAWAHVRPPRRDPVASRSRDAPCHLFFPHRRRRSRRCCSGAFPSCSAPSAPTRTATTSPWLSLSRRAAAPHPPVPALALSSCPARRTLSISHPPSPALFPAYTLSCRSTRRSNGRIFRCSSTPPRSQSSTPSSRGWRASPRAHGPSRRDTAPLSCLGSGGAGRRAEDRFARARASERAQTPHPPAATDACGHQAQAQGARQGVGADALHGDLHALPGAPPRRRRAAPPLTARAGLFPPPAQIALLRRNREQRRPAASSPRRASQGRTTRSRR